MQAHNSTVKTPRMLPGISTVDKIRARTFPTDCCPMFRHIAIASVVENVCSGDPLPCALTALLRSETTEPQSNRSSD